MTQHLLQADTIVGYTYKADILCLDCAYDASVELFRKGGGKVTSLSTESNLDCAAIYLQVDRYDEASFDSEEFPKVIFAARAQDEICGQCEGSLL